MAYTLSFGSITEKGYLYSSTIQIREGIHHVFFPISYQGYLLSVPSPSFWSFLMPLDRGPWKDCQGHCGKNPKEKVTGLTPPTPWSPCLISVSQTRHTFMRHYSDFPLHSQEEKTLKPS